MCAYVAVCMCAAANHKPAGLWANEQNYCFPLSSLNGWELHKFPNKSKADSLICETEMTSRNQYGTIKKMLKPISQIELLLKAKWAWLEVQ